MLVLCEKLMLMHASLYAYDHKLTETDLAEFIRLEYARVGADQNITPREIIRDFIEILDLQMQDPTLTLETLLASDAFSYARSEAVSDASSENYVEFTI